MTIQDNTSSQPINEVIQLVNNSGVVSAQVNNMYQQDGTGNLTFMILNPSAFFADNAGFTDFQQVCNNFKKEMQQTRQAWNTAHPQVASSATSMVSPAASMAASLSSSITASSNAVANSSSAVLVSSSVTSSQATTTSL